MKTIYPTRSEKYFVDLFRSATLHGAIERAAGRERGDVTEEHSSVPVDIVELARERGMEITEDLVGESCGEGLLIPSKVAIAYDCESPLHILGSVSPSLMNSVTRYFTTTMATVRVIKSEYSIRLREMRRNEYAIVLTGPS